MSKAALPQEVIFGGFLKKPLVKCSCGIFFFFVLIVGLSWKG